MDIGFEDENPFETEPERNHSDTSSSSRVAVSEPPSPLPPVARALSSPPQSPSLRRPTFPSQGSHRQPQTFKSEFCCARDQWLHSGEDVEILVSQTHPCRSVGLFVLDLCSWQAYSSVDCGRCQDVRKLKLAIYQRSVDTHIRTPILMSPAGTSPRARDYKKNVRPKSPPDGLELAGQETTEENLHKSWRRCQANATL